MRRTLGTLPRVKALWRVGVLLLATGLAVVGFWGAGSAEGGQGAVGALAVPLYWLAAYWAPWPALASPAVALVAGVALGNELGDNDNEYAWMNYFAGLVLCYGAVAWGVVQRDRERRARTIGDHPERPRRR